MDVHTINNIKLVLLYPVKFAHDYNVQEGRNNLFMREVIGLTGNNIPNNHLCSSEFLETLFGRSELFVY